VYLARLPAILGFGLMCLCAAALVRRHAPPLYAAAAFFLPYGTGLRWRAMDARPYGAMAGFCALALLCWDGMAGERHRTMWRVGFILSLAATFSTHFFSIVILLPLALGELFKWIKRKRLDWGSLASIAVALVPYMFWSPLLLASRHLMKHYFFQVSFTNLYEFFGSSIASMPLAGVLLLLFAAVALAGRLRVDETPWSAPTERQQILLALCAGFFLVPFAGYAAGVLVTGFFVPYNLVLTVFGLIIGLPLVTALITGRSQLVGLCVFLAIFGHGLFVTARGLSGYVRRDAIYPPLASVTKLIPDPNADIVISSTAHFLPFQEANRQDPDSRRLVYLFDVSKPLEEKGPDVADVVYSQLRGLTPARIEPFDSYLASHKRLYIAVMGETKGLQEWQVQYLREHVPARWTWRGRVGDFDIYQVDLGTG